jgi:uncharacterized protein YbjT (DUF2867 family)
METKKIVVCGATGTQGGSVVDGLLRRGGWAVVGTSRDPDGEGARALRQRGVEVVRADLDDEPSLREAFRGAHAVFGVTQPWAPDLKTCDVEAEIRQGRHIVDACAANGVGHLVFSTLFNPGRRLTGVPHVDSKLVIEAHVRASGLAWTFLRPVQFMDNIGMPFFPIRKGSVTGFIDRDCKVPYVSSRDIGEMAARVFAEPERFIGSDVDLVGDFVSGDELSQILTRLHDGRRVRYKATPKLLMRIFAKEFYAMRRLYETWGRPPFPVDFSGMVASSRRLLPEMISVESYLRSRQAPART